MRDATASAYELGLACCWLIMRVSYPVSTVLSMFIAGGELLLQLVLSKLGHDVSILGHSWGEMSPFSAGFRVVVVVVVISFLRTISSTPFMDELLLNFFLYLLLVLFLTLVEVCWAKLFVEWSLTIGFALLVDGVSVLFFLGAGLLLGLS